MSQVGHYRRFAGVVATSAIDANFGSRGAQQNLRACQRMTGRSRSPPSSARHLPTCRDVDMAPPPARCWLANAFSAGFRASPSARLCLWRRKKHRGLELIAAFIARPTVPRAAIIEIFGPIRRTSHVSHRGQWFFSKKMNRVRAVLSVWSAIALSSLAHPLPHGEG